MTPSLFRETILCVLNAFRKRGPDRPVVPCSADNYGKMSVGPRLRSSMLTYPWNSLYVVQGKQSLVSGRSTCEFLLFLLDSFLPLHDNLKTSVGITLSQFPHSLRGLARYCF